MKRIKIYALALAMAGATSCSDSFLDEKPRDFFSTENAFRDVNDFNASVNSLYAQVRTEFYSVNDFNPMEYLYRTDIAFQITTSVPNLDADFDPTSGIVSNHWERLFKIVAESNTILSRIPGSQLSDADRVLFEAKVKFFRAFAYRALAYLYGGVPLVTKEITVEKVDFERATREEIYEQAIEDLIFSAENLPAISAVKDGEVSNLAALHLLAEVYIANGEYQKAIDAATVVINDANTDLMTTRFGSRSTVTPGDVYWDLFQRGNQNRKSGNKEAIWVMQFETDVIGGGSTTTGFAQSWQLERVHPPLVRDVKVNGTALFLWPASNYNGGRGVGFLAPSLYFINNAYQDDYTDDIRNSNHNFVRAFKSNNPASPYYDQMIDFHDLPAGTTGISGAMTSGVPDRAFYPYQSKCTTPFDHPSAVYDLTSQPQFPYKLKSSAGGTYTDQYVFRLAETYLLRAEAYLGMNMTTEAAADINVVRARANADAVDAGDVSIDYILDERMREFGVEEKRMLTLMRLGKLYDRVKLCNPFYAAGIQPFHNLWPIPQSQIERNRGAEFPQNPGYDE